MYHRHMCLIFYVQRFIMKIKKKKKTYRFNVVRYITYIHKNKKENFSYVSN